MNFSCDIDVFRGWAEAICFGRFTHEVHRLFNVANVYKRAQGQGSIERVEGLERFRERHREALVWENLLPVGARRRNWRQTLVSDGFVVVRHTDLAATLAIADEFGSEVRMFAN
jgi:hypothetical protein